MRRKYLIGVIVIAVFAAFTLVAFSNSLTPYVNFAQAKATKNTVQVRGVLAADKIAVTDNGRVVKFPLRDEAGEEVTVVYAGTKPENLEHATSIVAVGKYAGGQFNAEKLLVKCPSKYQGSVNK